MVFDTRTVDTMKESLAHYFEISCEELVEFIKEAADNTQAKSRGLFNADIFTEELDAFLENIEATEQINGVMCFHFSRRINNTAPDFRTYNLKDLLLSDNPMSSFLNDSGYEFFEEDGHLAFKYNGIEYFPETGDEPCASLLANRLGRNSIDADYCFNGLAFGDCLMKNLYARSLFDGPEFLSTLAEYMCDDNLLENYKRHSTYYCFRCILPLESVIIDGHESFEQHDIIWYLIHQMAYRIMIYEDGEAPSTDDDNPIIRVADDAILPSEYIQSVEKITLDMLYA